MRELSMHILDALQNAREAGARQVDLSIDEDLEADSLTIVVRDDGRGMDADTARRALDPFFTTRTTRHVGLGLPLFAAAAERCGGALTLTSAPSQGTTVTARFQHGHLDRAPLGDMADTLLAFLVGAGDAMRLHYHHRRGDKVFELDSAAIRAELGEIPFSYSPVSTWLHDYVASGEAGLLETAS